MAFLKNVKNDNSLETGSEFIGNSTISHILREVQMIDDVSEKSKKLEFYVHLMKAEMLKIDGFKRELPFCMELLNDGIKILNRETLKLKGKRIESVVEEVRPFKSDGIGRADLSNDIYTKKNWLNSAQLWTASIAYEGHPFGDYQQEEKSDAHESPFLKMPKGGAFVPYRQDGGVGNNNGEKFVMLPPPPPPPSAAQEGPHQKRPERKQMRRCWSPQLHRRFVNALNQLGGAKVATPKQIRELMQVEGLTSDEVKSHLQKYRIHLRKLESSEPGDISPPPHGDPSLKLTMAIVVSQQGHSTAKSDNEEKSQSQKRGEVVVCDAASNFGVSLCRLYD